VATRGRDHRGRAGHRLRSVALLALVLVASSRATGGEGTDPLPSWNDGSAKRAVLDFVARVTKEGGPEFVPPAERIATFDNDGTLWAEQPIYFQLAFAMDRVKALAPSHPEWKDVEPFRSLLAGDPKAALEDGQKAVLDLVMATHGGMTTDEFEAVVRDWVASAKHPKLGRPYVECVYQPMVEVLRHLRANGFKTYIVSGGGVEFMRPWVEKAYGIPPEQVIGSRIAMAYELRDGKPVLVRLPKLDYVDDKAGKPIAIQQIVGRRPIAAFGNSDGDLPMLQWTTGGPGPRLGLIVHHTDAEREWAYDKGSPVGALDAALAEAPARGWAVVDMKKDWARVFP
jgi:phosphoserine phosphatase